MNDWAEFRHFKYLLAVLELQGFRAAAEHLHTAQPNLSIQAKQFQEYASVRLYEKAKDGRIKPTDAGIAFQFIARSLLDARDEAIESLAAIDRGVITSVRFGCSPLADQSLFQSFCQMHKELLPTCSIRPERANTPQLVDDVVAGVIDAAIVTLPVMHPALKIEELRKDRLVVCLRQDHPLATRRSLPPTDLQKHLQILYHPQQHPDAHTRLIEMLGDTGVDIEEYSRASHPTEMQTLVKEGYGFALLREGTALDSDLTTRPIAGVDWTVDTVVIYHHECHPKTIPAVTRQFKRLLRRDAKQKPTVPQKLPPASVKELPKQLELLR